MLQVMMTKNQSIIEKIQQIDCARSNHSCTRYRCKCPQNYQKLVKNPRDLLEPGDGSVEISCDLRYPDPPSSISTTNLVKAMLVNGLAQQFGNPFFFSEQKSSSSKLGPVIDKDPPGASQWPFWVFYVTFSGVKRPPCGWSKGRERKKLANILLPII